MPYPNVIVYSTPTCPYCPMAKQFLTQRGIPFIEKNVAADRSAAFEMMRKSGQQAVPQILVGDEMVVGFNRGRLETLLRQYETGDQKPQGRISLGVRVADAATHAPNGGQGAYVGYVKPSSLAERTGIQPGDTILALDGKSVNDADTLIAMSKQLTPGRPVQAVVMRDGERRTLTVPA